MTQPTPRDPDVYLVMMREVLIAQDLSLTITEFDPSARVITAADMDQALSLIAPTTSLAIAFAEVQPAPFAAHALARAIAERRGRVVLLGEQAEAVGPTQDWDVLRKPFVTDHVLSLLLARGGASGRTA